VWAHLVSPVDIESASARTNLHIRQTYFGPWAPSYKSGFCFYIQPVNGPLVSCEILAKLSVPNL